MTIGFLSMALASMAWGSVSDRLGARLIAVLGSAILAASLFLASLATSLLGFQLIFGLAVGGSVAAIFAPLMACVTGWFDTHRSLVVCLVSAGMGMAPLTMSPLAAWLVTIYDWRTSLQIIAVLVAVVMIPVALLVRPPPALAAENAASTDEESQSGTSLQQVIQSPQFIILLLTNFFCCATHSGPIFHTVSYAISCGIPMIAAVSIYSVEGLAGMGGVSPSVSSETGSEPGTFWFQGCCSRPSVHSPISSPVILARFTP
jgi:MFS family permease